MHHLFILLTLSGKVTPPPVFPSEAGTVPGETVPGTFSSPLKTGNLPFIAGVRSCRQFPVRNLLHLRLGAEVYRPDALAALMIVEAQMEMPLAVDGPLQLERRRSGRDFF